MGHCAEEKNACHCMHQAAHCDYGSREEMVWHLLKEAKLDLLSDKIRQKLEAAEGKKMDEIARMLVEAKVDLKKSRLQTVKRQQELDGMIDEVFA